MQSKAPNRPRLNSIDRQRAAVNAPTGPRAQVFVVVAQVPHQIRDLIDVPCPVMRDARDATQCVVGFRASGVDLADDRVLGAVDGRERCHGCAHPVATAVRSHRFQSIRRIREAQFSCVGKQFEDIGKPTVVDAGRVEMDQVSQCEPVRGSQTHVLNASRCAHADSRSLASSMSVIGGIARTTR